MSFKHVQVQVIEHHLSTMAYQGPQATWQKPENSWSPNAPTSGPTSPHNGPSASLPTSPPPPGFQIPPYLSATAQQAINDIGGQMDREYFKTIPGCLSTLGIVRTSRPFLPQISTNSTFCS
jgi:hypothetical protein